MKRYSAFAVPVIFAALAVTAAPVHAQIPEAAAVAAPIVVHTLTPKKKVNPSSTSWMKAEVIHADANSMVVSEQGNERAMHTFTYSDKVKTKMQKVISSRNYQYGDKIKIRYTPGQTVALKIHGKPSKSS